MLGFAIGFSSTIVVLMLGWLAIRSGHTTAAIAVSIRDLGTLTTLVTGVLSAIWWHQSADLSNEIEEQDPPDKKLQQAANSLNGAAATSTALALIAGVFSGLDWASLEGGLAAICFIFVLSASSKELGNAILISMGQKIGVRSSIGLLIILLALSLFVYRHL